MEFYISKPPIFSFSECLWFLDRGYDDCLFRISNQEVIKAINIEGVPLLFSVKDADNGLKVKVLNEGIDSDENKEKVVKKYITEWFDLEKDLSPFYNLVNQDSRVAYMAKDFKGLRLIGIEDLFEAICWSIIGQQINLNFAYKLKRRLVELCGKKITLQGVDYYLFPEPEDVMSIPIADFQKLQFSLGKAKYLLEAAKAFVEKRISKNLLVNMPDFQARQAVLTSIKGVGIWTANYVLMKSLRDSESIPFGDVGLLKALVTHKIIEERGEVKKIADFFENYKGWESYMVFYLWRSLSAPVFQSK